MLSLSRTVSLSLVVLVPSLGGGACLGFFTQDHLWSLDIHCSLIWFHEFLYSLFFCSSCEILHSFEIVFKQKRSVRQNSIALRFPIRGPDTRGNRASWIRLQKISVYHREFKIVTDLINARARLDVPYKEIKISRPLFFLTDSHGGLIHWNCHCPADCTFP